MTPITNENELVSPAVVQVRGLNKVFFTENIETHALSDVSFEIGLGEYVLIRGPSGCGKSTLLSILGLLEPPTSGEYLLDGLDTRDLSLTQRARLRNRTLGFVFQSFNLITKLTILENVELPLRYRRGSEKASAVARTDRAMQLLESVGIAHRAGHYPTQLSGGEQQRAAVARAVIGEPSLILADEPTGNLDSESEDAVMRLMTKYHAQGTTLCVVSHNPKYAQVANRTLFLSAGRLAARSHNGP